MGQHDIETLLRFFKVLANENRLKILGVLADRECGVEELAALLDLKAPTVSHHLDKLRTLGFVDMRTDGNDHLYRLSVDSLQEMSKRVFSSFSAESVVSLADDVEYDAWESKVLGAFVDGDQITRVPAGYKKRLVILKWLVNCFDEGREYSEKEVNEIIERHHPDYCLFRREFVMNGLMERRDGVYRRVEWQLPELV